MNEYFLAKGRFSYSTVYTAHAVLLDGCVVCVSFPQTKSLCPATPLTARVWLKENAMPVTPVSTATQSVSKLQGLLSGRKTTPSDALLAIFRSVTAVVTCRRHVSLSRVLVH